MQIQTSRTGTLPQWVFVAALLVLLGPRETQAQFETKLTASDAAEDDHFGQSVSVSGDVALVGAHTNDDDGLNSGSAYVYRFDGKSWVEEQNLTASDAAAGDLFGWSVSVSGDVAVAGTTRKHNESGSAYVYRFDGTSWVEEQKLTASDAAIVDVFGVSVSVSGDLVLVGASHNDDGGTDSGSAYVFRFDGTSWVEEQKLTAGDAAADDQFGRSVSLNGDVALVGAYLDDTVAGTDVGSAYVFRFDGTSWVEEQKLTGSDAADNDWFGRSVSLSGDVALVGTLFNDDDGQNSGSAYVYRFDGTSWVQEQKLTASDAADGDNLGGSVSVSGEVALVGAVGNEDDGSVSGSAYVYRFDGISWVEAQKLTASDAAALDRFGDSVSVNGDVALVGAVGNDDDGTRSGSAYVYHLSISIICGETDYELLLQAEVDAFPSLCTEVVGDLDISGPNITNLNALSSLTSVGGDVSVVSHINGAGSLTNLDGLSALTSVGGSLQISNIAALIDARLSSLTSVGGAVSINSNVALTDLNLPVLTFLEEGLLIVGNAVLTNLDGLSAITSAGSVMITSNAMLTSLGGLFGLASVGSDVSINNNDALSNLDGLSGLTSVGWNLEIVNNAALTNLDGLSGITSVGINLDIVNNAALATCSQGLWALVSGGGVVGTITMNTNDPLGDCNNDGADLVAGVDVEDEQDTGVPTEFALGPAYPNPFRSTTQITFALPRSSYIRLVVYNVLGQVGPTLFDGYKNAGQHSISIDAQSMSAGVYMYVFEADGFATTRRMVLLR